MTEKEPEQPEAGSEVEELKRKLEADKKRSDEYLDRLKYAQADIENLTKRYDRQLEETRKYCTEPLVVKLLDVVDELELAVKHSRSSRDVDTLVQGVEMTLKKLQKVLKEEGVTPIEAIGKPFDPSRHVAVARIESEDGDDCMVVEEVRKGYVMREKVIRPSAVKVTAKSSSKPETGGCMQNE